MTTVATDGRVMSGDSMVVHMEQIVGSHRKVNVVQTPKLGMVLVGYSGCLDSGIVFLDWVKRGMNQRTSPKNLSDDFVGLLVDGTDIYEFGAMMVPIRIESEFWSIGSGAQAAMGAMKMGADPTRALQIACEIDPNTGGSVISASLLTKVGRT